MIERILFQFSVAWLKHFKVRRRIRPFILIPSLSSHIKCWCKDVRMRVFNTDISGLQWTFKDLCVVSVIYILYCLTTPEQGWFQCWFHRPRAEPRRRGLPWPTPARRSRLKCPCGNLRPSVAYAGTWQHTAFLLPSRCIFLPLQTFPWETKRGQIERVRRQNNHNHITGFWNIWDGSVWYPSSQLDYI